MKTLVASQPPRRAVRGGHPAAFTLVEMLVVVSIIAVLMALLFPAMNAARMAGQQATCKNNLRQFGVGFHQHAEKFGTFCTGAFDWKNNGSATEIGWVADMVNVQIPAGKMLCPTNPIKVSATYNDLFTLDTTLAANQLFSTYVDQSNLSTTGSSNCVSHLAGSSTSTQTFPDGTSSTIVNPCRQITAGTNGASTALASGDPNRLGIVNSLIYAKYYNTNYTASWWLVRSGVVLDSNGNLTLACSNCGTATLQSRASTLGPLTRDRADSSNASASSLPFLACGGPLTTGRGGTPANAPVQLTSPVGTTMPPSGVTVSFTAGPVGCNHLATGDAHRRRLVDPSSGATTGGGATGGGGTTGGGATGGGGTTGVAATAPAGIPCGAARSRTESNRAGPGRSRIIAALARSMAEFAISSWPTGACRVSRTRAATAT